MGEYGREQRNKLSRAIANSEAGSRQLKGFVDNRPSQILPSNILYGFSKKMPIQKKAYDDNLPIKYTACRENAIIIDNPTISEKQVIDDPYNRYYESENEFRDHVGGNPVPCGLIKNLALWYRIPFLGSEFFVLGEQHNHLSYSSIVKESNQALPVLGEAGIIPIDSKNPLVYNGMIGEAPAVSMESVLSKTYFALSALEEVMKEVPPKDDFTPESPETWIASVESGIDVSREQKNGYCAPYYIDDTKKHQLNDDVAETEKSYSALNTIKAVMNLCIVEIEKKMKLKRDPDFEKLKWEMTFMLAFWKDFNPSVDQITKVKDICKKCAEDELGRAGLKKVNNSVVGDWDNANSMREAYMLRAISIASTNGFLLAGIGNAHAKHLKPMLDPPIKTILLEEFMTTDYTRDAFSSSHSSIPDPTTD